MAFFNIFWPFLRLLLTYIMIHYKIWVLWLIFMYRNPFWKNIFWKCIKGALPTSVGCKVQIPKFLYHWMPVLNFSTFLSAGVNFHIKIVSHRCLCQKGDLPNQNIHGISEIRLWSWFVSLGLWKTNYWFEETTFELLFVGWG